MRYLLDTDHCSHLQRGHPEIIRRLTTLPPEAVVVTSVITQAELLAGIALAPSELRRKALRETYEKFLLQISDILPITSEVAEQFAEIYARLRRKGRMIPVNDIWIAAIALAHGLILVSSDEHFRLIDGLQVEDWTKPSDQKEGETQ